MYSKTLSYTSESDVTFQCNSNSIEILVSGTSLGKINSNFPVTVYVTVAGSGAKAITMEEISDDDYIYHNNASRTVVFNQQNANNGLHISKCETANKFVCIGVDDENIGVTCGSGNCEEYFDISANMHFKAKMEISYVGSQTVYRMFVRYSQDVVGQCGTNPVCDLALFCYTCLS